MLVDATQDTATRTSALKEKAMEIQKEHGKVKLIFSKPVRIMVSSREAKELDTHITNIFKSAGDSLCYTTVRSRHSGYRFSSDMLDAWVDVQVPQKVTYEKQWASIAKSMRKHEINLDIAEAIEKHLRGDEPHIRGFQNYWTINDKPKLMSFADVTRGRSIAEMKKLATKSEYGDYLYFRASIDGQRRDRSIGLQEKSDHSGWKFYSASEFSGCGNGDYYMMYNPTMAFYAESD